MTSELLLAIYSSATSDHALRHLLSLLAMRFGCSSAALLYVDAHRPAATLSVGYGVFADPSVQELYLRDFAALDPAPAAMARLAIGEVSSTDQMFPEDIHAAYEDFLKGFYYRLGLGGAMGGPLANRDGQVGMIAVQRSLDRAPFAVDELATFRSLMPHIAQAFELRRAFFDIETRATRLEQAVAPLALGIVVLGRDGALQHANLTARTILGRADGLSLDPTGRLRAADQKLDRLLATAIQRADQTGRPDILVVPRTATRHPYVLRVTRAYRADLHPAASAVSVLLSDTGRDPGDPTALLRAAFGMSDESAQLTAALMNGDDLASYATRAGVTVNTVKFHLKGAFAATDTRRQVDLVRLAVALTRDIL